MEIKITPPKRFFLARLLCWLGLHRYWEIKSDRLDLHLRCVRDFCDEGEVRLSLGQGGGGVWDRKQAGEASDDRFGPARPAPECKRPVPGPGRDS